MTDKQYIELGKLLEKIIKNDNFGYVNVASDNVVSWLVLDGEINLTKKQERLVRKT